VSLANLELFEEDQTLEKLAPKIDFLHGALERFKKLRHVGDVRQVGFMVGIELVKDRSQKTAYDWKDKIGMRVIQAARRDGAIIRPLGNVIVLMPPLAMKLSELKRLVNITHRSIKAVTEN